MKSLLSHVKTKMGLSSYLGGKIFDKACAETRRVIVAWVCECKCSHTDMGHLRSNQEEAETKILLHAVVATSRGASGISIHSPDTDVLVLAVRWYPLLCPSTTFVTGTGQKRRSMPLKPIYDALGPMKAAVLPEFHPISGCDNTGSFSGKGKVTLESFKACFWWYSSSVRSAWFKRSGIIQSWDVWCHREIYMWRVSAGNRYL